MTPAITGHTRLIAHIGVPTESFRSPMIYNPYFKARGIDVVVVPMGCEVADFPDFLRLVLRLRNIVGALITMPHKMTAAALVDAPSRAVAICGAANAVKREGDQLIGDMFDGEGFVRGARGKGCRIEGASAIMAGAGGVGSAIAAALAKAGLARLAIHDTRAAATDALAANLRAHYPDLAVTAGTTDPAGFDIVINATPLGMNEGDPLPFDAARIDPAAFVGEVVLSREVTPFLAAVRMRGCATQVGTDMLYEMVPAYLEFFGLPMATPAELRHFSQVPS